MKELFNHYKKEILIYTLLTLFTLLYYNNLILLSYICLMISFLILLKEKKLNHSMIPFLSIALFSRYPLLFFYVILYIFKDGIMSLIIYLLQKKQYNVIRRKERNNLIFIILAHIILFLDLDYYYSGIIIDILIVERLISLLIDLYYLIMQLRGKHDKKLPLLRVTIIVLAVFITIAIIPYYYQPEISEEYEESFDTDSFYETVSNDRATILEDNSDALAKRLNAIESAKQSIIFSTFDFRTDTSGKMMVSALYKAALRGVDIKIIIDGFNGVLRLDNDPYLYFLSSLDNVHIKIYNPISLLEPQGLNSRLHDKYVIIDNDLYILGGRNSFDYFLGDYGDKKNYDREVLVYNESDDENKSIYQIKEYFEEIWSLDLLKTVHTTPASSFSVVESVQNELDTIYNNMKEDYSDWFETIDYEQITVETKNITLLSNPTSIYSKEPIMFYSLSELIKNADEALIHTPYIICNNMMYESLEEMCETTNVTLMTNSATNNGNPFGAIDYAINKEKLAATGLNILEYNGGVSYHGKSILLDDDLSIVGSFNFDIKSTYQDTELMLVIYSEDFNDLLREKLYTYHEDASYMTNSDDVATLTEGNLFNKFLEIVDPFVRALF